MVTEQESPAMLALSGICLMLAAAAVACGRASPLAGSNAVRNRVSSAPIDRHQLCRAPFPLTRSRAQVGVRLGLDRIEEFAIQIPGGRTRCGRPQICAGSNSRNNQQSSAQAMPQIASGVFAQPRAAVFGFLILDESSRTPAWRSAEREPQNGSQSPPGPARLNMAGKI